MTRVNLFVKNKSKVDFNTAAVIFLISFIGKKRKNRFARKSSKAKQKTKQKTKQKRKATRREERTGEQEKNERKKQLKNQILKKIGNFAIFSID